jgi:hypothetical protein
MSLGQMRRRASGSKSEQSMLTGGRRVRVARGRVRPEGGGSICQTCHIGESRQGERGGGGR